MNKILKSTTKFIRERIKVIYYNLKQPNYKFRLKNKHYKTIGKNWSIKTCTPLYFVTKEINRYEKFYKIVSTDVIIDAGAFHGILSLVYSQKAKNGNVYSFEPDKLNLKHFRNNLSLNNDPENIQVIQKGLWNEQSRIKFYEDGSVASSSYYKAENAVEKTIEVTSLDDFVLQYKLKKIDFIKMDVEGAELEILKGAKQMLLDFQPNLSVATYHFVKGELTYKSVEVFFKELNYPYKTIFFEDGEIITYAGPVLNN